MCAFGLGGKWKETESMAIDTVTTLFLVAIVAGVVMILAFISRSIINKEKGK